MFSCIYLSFNTNVGIYIQSFVCFGAIGSKKQRASQRKRLLQNQSGSSRESKQQRREHGKLLFVCMYDVYCVYESIVNLLALSECFIGVAAQISCCAIVGSNFTSIFLIISIIFYYVLTLSRKDDMDPQFNLGDGDNMSYGEG